MVVGSGAKLTDSATLSGGFNPTGTITFTLHRPEQYRRRHRDSHGQWQRHLQHAHRLLTHGNRHLSVVGHLLRRLEQQQRHRQWPE